VESNAVLTLIAGESNGGRWPEGLPLWPGYIYIYINNIRAYVCNAYKCSSVAVHLKVEGSPGRNDKDPV
jgi:hypothetical protein